MLSLAKSISSSALSYFKSYPPVALPLVFFLGGDEQWLELCIALLALCSETQCHAPLSQSCLGLQVTSCLPVFLSSGTAGAINQLPPANPAASVCPDLTTTAATTATSECLIWSVAPPGDVSQLLWAWMLLWICILLIFMLGGTWFLNLSWHSHATFFF